MAFKSESIMKKKYCESIYRTKRFLTREVMVGNVGVGGKNPVRIQSMTTSKTHDVEATIEQAIRLADAGCEIVRVTVQGMKEAEACEHIKNGLVKRGYDIPLVADIHFYPPAAMAVAEFVDKVRINPGNFVDKRATFKQLEYDDESYAAEIRKIEDKFSPLIEKCIRLKRSIRIGTNHGSLSDRIMNRYGDTPAGMVESALEFARVCRQMNYHDIIFSMKSSNPQVMIQAYRLLNQAMMELGWDYPLHLGVTEAGDGEDGRVKSAMGIGTLLLDGLGDTIRVSLTEDPWYEIDPCSRLVNLAAAHEGKGVAPFEEHFRTIEDIQRRKVHFSLDIPMHRNGTVFLSASPEQTTAPNFFQQIGCDGSFGQPKLKSLTADNLVFKDSFHDKEETQRLQQVREIGVGIFSYHSATPAFMITPLREAVHARQFKTQADRFAVSLFSSHHERLIVDVQDTPPEEWEALIDLKPELIILSPSKNRLHYCRQFFEWLQSHQLDIPVVLHFSYDCSVEDLTILASMELGALLCDGFGEGVWIEGPYPADFLRRLSFSLLQAARMRMSKTDFISCPSCGRTLFDLQDVTRRIQSRTSHLPGVKIAIMGCIVNGPGEMADADFGYVGSKPGKIDLYVGKECVEKGIDFSEADDRLVALIKAHGCWVEPVEEEATVQ
jgi:(E)-4-hydroxy-3-methylbut-2-enyl-diphosphate synthase